MNVAGIDVSTKRIGYAAPDGSLHSIETRTGPEDVARRLSELVRGVEQLLDRYPPRPDLLVVEGYSLASPGRLALVRLGEIGGALRVRLFERDLAYVEIAPSNLKRFATGSGSADKDRMMARARDAGGTPRNHDEADAFHLRRMGLAATGNLLEHLDPHEIDAIATSGVAW